MAKLKTNKQFWDGRLAGTINNAYYDIINNEIVKPPYSNRLRTSSFFTLKRKGFRPVSDIFRGGNITDIVTIDGVKYFMWVDKTGRLMRIYREGLSGYAKNRGVFESRGDLVIASASSNTITINGDVPDNDKNIDIEVLQIPVSGDYQRFVYSGDSRQNVQKYTIAPGTPGTRTIEFLNTTIDFSSNEYYIKIVVEDSCSFYQVGKDQCTDFDGYHKFLKLSYAKGRPRLITNVDV